MKIKHNWWKSNFDETYFKAFSFIYSAERAKKEIDFILKLLPIRKKDKILDLPCGQGRHSIELARRGYDVTGVDYSKYLLKQTKKESVNLDSKPNFIKSDMRDFRIRNKFDIILTLGNSFGYFKDEDNQLVIKNISYSLKKGGYFVLDLPNTAGMLRKQDNIKGAYEIKIPNGVIKTENLDFDPLSFILKLKWTINLKTIKKEFEGFFRLYTFSEISAILNKYNLEVKDTYGSFTGVGYDLDSPRLILVCKKK